MAAGAGRNLKLARSDGAAGYDTIAGLRTKSLTIAHEPIDVTDDDDDGIRTFLETAAGELDPASRMIDLSASGITKDDVLLAAAASGAGLLLEHKITFPSGATIIGDFAMSNFEETGEYQDATTFSVTLQSHGPWVYAAAA